MEDGKISLMKRVFDSWRTRDFDSLVDLAHPEIFAQVGVPPDETKRTYRGRDEILAFLREGDETYDHFEAEPHTFTVGPAGRVLAEGSVRYKPRVNGGMAALAYWVCEIREGKIAWWQSFSDRSQALQAAGLAPPVAPSS